ncbi:MAG: hypothetical protein HPY52_00345 [Firmicutes bacterium]|nr:hypothetical protein [Bacillota bacterium]
MTDRLTERQISRLRKDFEQKRNRDKMKERLKTRRQEKRGRRHDPPRRDRETIDLIDEFFDREADFDE